MNTVPIHESQIPQQTVTYPQCAICGHTLKHKAEYGTWVYPNGDPVEVIQA